MKIKTLSENVSNVFHIKSINVDTTTMVRTGVIDSKLSFIHAILRCCSDDYISSDSEQKIKIAEKINKNIENTKTLISKIIFDEALDIMEKLYKCIEKNKDSTNSNVSNVFNEITLDKKALAYYQILIDIITIKDINRIVPYDPLSTEAGTKPYIDKIMEFYCQNKYVKKLDEIRKKYMGDLVRNLLLKCFSEAEAIHADKNAMIALLSSHFDINIYIIDPVTRLILSKSNIENRNTIILLNIGDKFETIGKLCDENMIKRQFKNTDRVVKQIERNVILNKKSMSPYRGNSSSSPNPSPYYSNSPPSSPKSSKSPTPSSPKSSISYFGSDDDSDDN